jgi:putative DNA primase/helicase
MSAALAIDPFRQITINDVVDVDDVNTRCAVRIGLHDIEAFIEFYSDRDTRPRVLSADRLANDLRRHGAAIGDFEALVLALEAPDERGDIEARWAASDRERQPTDLLLIDMIEQALWYGLIVSPGLFFDIERFRDALESRKQDQGERLEVALQCARKRTERFRFRERLAQKGPQARADHVAYQKGSRELSNFWKMYVAPDTNKPVNLAQLAEYERREAELTAQYGYVYGQGAAATNVIPFPGPSIQPGNSLMLPRGHVEFIPSTADESLAEQFASEHADDLRYVAVWGRWFEWEGRRWRADDTLRAYDLARALCRKVANVIADTRESVKIASAQKVAAVERMAKADRRIAATVEQWDLDPWLLNTPTGVMDLRTGAMRSADPADYMTKITAAAPGGDCPTWLAFLHRITAGDGELIAFIQRMLGYALTGTTREHAMFFGYGTGANGKSVLLSTVSGILGNYHTTAPIETFTASAQERHPTDLAGLRGARLVTATETEEGRRWAESKIKALTGGDKISARFMRQDFFEFTPSFKLMIAGNHKPGLRSVDEAIRRRIHLIPFTVTIPPAERDHTLTDKLRTEWPGILAWMIAGCLKWQAEGLQPPKAVRDATTHYLDAEDALGAWLDERCERDPAAWTARDDLFRSWSMWATAAGEFVGSSRKFLSALETRGFEDARQNNRRGFRGLRLRPMQMPLPPEPRV